MASYDECWDNEDSTEDYNFIIDPGTNFGRGRGFVPAELRSSYGNDSDGCKNGGAHDVQTDYIRSNPRGNFEFRGRGSGRRGERGGRSRWQNRGRDRGRGRSGGGNFANENHEYQPKRGRGRGRDQRNATTGSGGYHRNAETDSDSRGGYQRNAETGGGRGRRGTDTGESAEKPREVYIPPEPTDDEETMFASGISSGSNFHKYDIIQVNVTGENVPKPIEHFNNSGLRQILLDNIQKSGYVRPTPVQKHAVPIIMAGRDLMACAQTGSGKTAAFLLPVINSLLSNVQDVVVSSEHCEPQAIIVSPTRELTLQIFNEARKFSHGSVLKTVVTYGGAAAYHQAQRARNGCHILVATPGRLLDFVDKGRIKFSSLRFLVLDEADRMLDMGFMPDIERMMAHSTMVPTGERQTLMFSATFPEEIQRLAGKFLDNYLFLAVGIVGSACSDVEQKFHLVNKFEKRPKLLDLISEEGDEKTMVFVEKKRTADFIAAFLSEQNHPTTSIHGDRLQREREEALADFKTGRMGVLVATAVAARGLDIKNVSHVVNFDLPKSIDEYVHRIGRTGRVGNRGKATSFYDSEIDAPLAKDLIKILQQAGQEVPSWLEKDAVNAVSSYTRPGHFGGKDFRKFENKDSDVDNSFGTPTNASYNDPSLLEPEELW